MSSSCPRNWPIYEGHSRLSLEFATAQGCLMSKTIGTPGNCSLSQLNHKLARHSLINRVFEEAAWLKRSIQAFSTSPARTARTRLSSSSSLLSGRRYKVEVKRRHRGTNRP